MSQISQQLVVFWGKRVSVPHYEQQQGDSNAARIRAKMYISLCGPSFYGKTLSQDLACPQPSQAMISQWDSKPHPNWTPMKLCFKS